MEIKIKKLSDSAITPIYGTTGAACFDLFADSACAGHGRVIVSTGLIFEIPEGFEMVIRPRSGLAFKDGIHAFIGTIDSDYRGEVKLLLVSEYQDVIVVDKGQRVVQAKIQPVQQVSFKVVDDLSSTERGGCGFGSTGL